LPQGGVQGQHLLLFIIIIIIIVVVVVVVVVVFSAPAGGDPVGILRKCLMPVKLE